jgi:hypothetical protein
MRGIIIGDIVDIDLLQTNVATLFQYFRSLLDEIGKTNSEVDIIRRRLTLQYQLIQEKSKELNNEIESVEDIIRADIYLMEVDCDKKIDTLEKRIEKSEIEIKNLTFAFDNLKIK